MVSNRFKYRPTARRCLCDLQFNHRQTVKKSTARPAATTSPEPRASNRAARVSKRMFGSRAGELSTDLRRSVIWNDREKNSNIRLLTRAALLFCRTPKSCQRSKKFQHSTMKQHGRIPTAITQSAQRQQSRVFQKQRLLCDLRVLCVEVCFFSAIASGAGPVSRSACRSRRCRRG
jgi:hypothetical protein